MKGASQLYHLEAFDEERENTNSKALFYKDCSLGLVKNLSNLLNYTDERERETDRQTDRDRDRENSNSKTLFYKDCNLGLVKIALI